MLTRARKGVSRGGGSGRLIGSVYARSGGETEPPPTPTQTARPGAAVRREAHGSIHLVPQHRRNVVVVHVRPVRPEAVRVVSPHVGDDLAVERNLGGSLLRLFAVPLGPVLALAVPAVIHGEGGQVGGRSGTVDVDLRHGRTGTVLAGAVEAGADHGHL